MPSVSSFLQDMLCRFNTILSYFIGLRISSRGFNMFKLIFLCKLLKLAAVKLWSVVRGNSVWKSIFCQMGLQFVNNRSGRLGHQHIQLKEVRITVSGNQVVGAIEFKQVR